MIDIREALWTTGSWYPNGPEKLVESLPVTVFYTPLQGCSGWCTNFGDKAIIRISSSLAKVRQRFTLAHELSHLILGAETHVTQDNLTDLWEELEVNILASEMLLPASKARSGLAEGVAANAVSIDRLAKDANVSWMVVARRFAHMNQSTKLTVAVARIAESGKMIWSFPRSKFKAIAFETCYSVLSEKSSIEMEYDDGESHFKAILHKTPHSNAVLLQKFPVIVEPAESECPF